MSNTEGGEDSLLPHPNRCKPVVELVYTLSLGLGA